MKIMLSNDDIWRCCQGLSEVLDQEEKEKGVAPGPEDENMILLNALLDFSAELTAKGGFALVKTCPFRSILRQNRGSTNCPIRNNMMAYSIIGSHSDGAYTMDAARLHHIGIDANLKQLSQHEVIDIADHCQRQSDASGYQEWFTVFDRNMEIYRTHSQPATFYRVHYREDAMSDEQVIREQFSDLEKAKEIAGRYPWWSIYRAYDYSIVDYQWGES